MDRQKALLLRREGKTYSEIRRELGISKSTLSGWLGAVQLSESELKLLQLHRKKSKDIAVEKTRITKQGKRQLRLSQQYEEQKNILLPLSNRELLIAGLFLYWGEGNKNLQGSISINNTDPQVLKFSLYWITEVLLMPRSKIKVCLHLYSDMSIDDETSYWSKELNIPVSQFTNPYIKKSKRVGIDHKGFGHGTCTVRVNDVHLKESIIMGIKSIADRYGNLLSSR